MNFKLVLAEPLDNSLGSHVETFLKHHGGPGLQHIGLTTDKATETVQIMLDKGAQFRKPPPTYYQLVILSTMWKFQDFSVIQILREITFGDSRNSKIAIFCYFCGSEILWIW